MKKWRSYEKGNVVKNLKISLQYQICLILAAAGLAIAIPFLDNIWSLFGLMLLGGAIILFFMNIERRWINPEYLKFGLIATIVLAISYGVYEYLFFDAGWNTFFHLASWFEQTFGDKYYYWGFMTILNFMIVFIFSRKSIGMALCSIPLFAVNEDLWYWITKSVHELRYVFPVGNWFDTRFPFLQGLGEGIPIFPEWPRFYFVGWMLVSILLIIQLKNLQDRKFIIAVGIFVGTAVFCTLLAIV